MSTYSVVALVTCIVLYISTAGSTAVPDLTSGRVQRTLGVGEQTVQSTISYVHYVTSPDMPKYQRSINKYLSNSIGSIWQDQPDHSTSELSREWYVGILAEFDSMYAHTDEVADGSHPWTLLDSTQITDPVIINGRPTELVQVYRTRYQFTGGAHGLPTTISALFNRKTGDVVSFKELLQRNSRAFTSIAERFFRKQQHIPARRSLKGAGYWFPRGFHHNDNIRFLPDSVEIIYNPYEIAPYVFGTITVRIPTLEVIPLLQLPFSGQP
jgi:hypothetical protein